MTLVRGIGMVMLLAGLWTLASAFAALGPAWALVAATRRHLPRWALATLLVLITTTAADWTLSDQTAAIY